MAIFSCNAHARFILIAGEDGVFFAAPDVPGAPKPLFAAAGSQNAVEAIRRTLVQHPRVPLMLYADTLAQDFRLETLPGINLLDRAKLAQRRLKQAFPHARLLASLKLSRTRMMLAGLQDNSPALDWLDRLQPHNVQVGLLPVECAALAPQLAPEAAEGWILLFSRTRSGGFRQIVTHEGEIVFTRLTPNLPTNASAEDIAAVAARDIRASLDYLARLGLEDSRHLYVLALMPDAMRAALSNLKLPVQSLRVLSPAQAAEQLDLPIAADAKDTYSDLLFTAWLARRAKLRLALQTPEIKESRQAAIVRRVFTGCATAVFLFALGVTGWQAADLALSIYDNHQAAVALDARTQKLTQEQKDSAPITQPLGRLRLALGRQSLFAALQPMPWGALQALNRGLGGEGRLVKFDWHDDAKDNQPRMAAEVRLVPAPSLSPGDREATVARFQALARQVASAMPTSDVRVTRYPFPALPQEALTNRDADKDIAVPVTTAELTILPHGVTP